MWPAVRGWVQVAAETEPTLSVQVLEVSGCVCGRLLLDQAGTLAVDWQEKGRSSAAGLGRPAFAESAGLGCFGRKPIAVFIGNGDDDVSWRRVPS